LHDPRVAVLQERILALLGVDDGEQREERPAAMNVS
jgi:hypothetical protein